jgi:hypothetical protein
MVSPNGRHPTKINEDLGMTSEEMESWFRRFFEISTDLQKKQLRNEEQIADLIDYGRRTSRDIRDLLEIVRSHERRIDRLEIEERLRTLERKMRRIDEGNG